MTLIPQGPYRCLYRHEGELHPTGVMSYMEAIHLVDTNQAEVAVLDREGWPQFYPNTGDKNEKRTKL